MAKKFSYEDAEDRTEEFISKIEAERLLIESGENVNGTDGYHGSESFRKLNLRGKHLRIRRLVQHLTKNNPEVLIKLDVPNNELKRLLSDPEKLSVDDWKEFGEIYFKLLELKKKHPTDFDNEEHVEQEWKDSQRKRHNVKEDWLGL